MIFTFTKGFTLEHKNDNIYTAIVALQTPLNQARLGSKKINSKACNCTERQDAVWLQFLTWVLVHER